MKSSTLYDKVTTLLETDLGPSFRANGLALDNVTNAATSLLGLSLFRKATDLKGGLTPKELEAKAVLGFLQTEEACRQTNWKLRHDRGALRPKTIAVLNRSRLKIGRLIGDWNYAEAFQRCSHGPGSTRTVNRAKLGNDTKYDETVLSVTREALSLSRILTMGVSWARARGIAADGPCSLSNSEWVCVEGDKIAFAPKSSTSLRVISVGPTLNVYGQLGLGEMLEHRLKRWGINLSDQTVNSNLARYASITGEHATVDLKTASALICRELVWDQFPIDLVLLMDRLRSRHYVLPDDESGTNHPPQVRTYQMFSGMGNGFTFPMQTILFHALAASVCEELGLDIKWNATYGDDIIVPVAAYPLLVETFHDLGLAINESKSFFDGPFRESCGGQYYDGHDIRPVYWKGFDGSVTAREVCVLAHQLMLWWHRSMEHSNVSIHRTLQYLRGVAFRLDATCPTVPCNAPIGYGFPENWCGFVTMVLNRYVFQPLRRAGRDAALLAYTLDSECRGIDHSWTDGNLSIHALGIAGPVKRPLRDLWEHEIDLKEGKWRKKRSETFLGKIYPR